MADPFVPPVAPINAPPPCVPACPKCGNAASTKVGFNWCGGAVGPRLFHVVRCDSCRTQFNGKTGGSLTTTIIVYQVIVFAFLGAALYLGWNNTLRPLLFPR